LAHFGRVSARRQWYIIDTSRYPCVNSDDKRLASSKNLPLNATLQVLIDQKRGWLEIGASVFSARPS
jgi:hypothetical protein